MAQVDFYVLDSPGAAARQRFACRLAEKAYRLKNTVHILADTRESAMQLDELLWTFRDGSFVPHEISSADGAAEAPVTIGYGSHPSGAHDLLINLSDEVAVADESVPRVAEIVSSDDDSLRRSRRRFATYRHQRHTLETHKL
jgi:DNA polymerase-3 subunit chi